MMFRVRLVNGIKLGVDVLFESRKREKMQLVHLDITRAKKSTSREEYREAFFAYMQREDC